MPELPGAATKIALVEDHPVRRRAVRQVLDTHPRFELVADLDDLPAHREPVAWPGQHPRMVLLGCDDAEQVHQRTAWLGAARHAAVVVLYPGPDPTVVTAATGHGLDGVVCAQTPTRAFIDVLLAATARPDQPALCPVSAAALGRQTLPGGQPREGVLTARQRDVLWLAASGLPPEAIASRLGCAPTQVVRHLARARVKLGATDLHAAVARVRELDEAR